MESTGQMAVQQVIGINLIFKQEYHMDMTTFDKLGLTYYSIMDAPDDVLNKFFDDATREELIGWLSWNDRNGVYNDEDHMNEFGCLMTKEDGIENMKNQILPNRVVSEQS